MSDKDNNISMDIELCYNMVKELLSDYDFNVSQKDLYINKNLVVALKNHGELFSIHAYNTHTTNTFKVDYTGEAQALLNAFSWWLKANS